MLQYRPPQAQARREARLESFSKGKNPKLEIRPGNGLKRKAGIDCCHCRLGFRVCFGFRISKSGFLHKSLSGPSRPVAPNQGSRRPVLAFPPDRATPQGHSCLVPRPEKPAAWCEPRSTRKQKRTRPGPAKTVGSLEPDRSPRETVTTSMKLGMSGFRNKPLRSR